LEVVPEIFSDFSSMMSLFRGVVKGALGKSEKKIFPYWKKNPTREDGERC